MYRTITKMNIGFINEQAMASMTISIIENIMAVLTEISPDAIGLYFFFGCARSALTSIISFMMYTILEVIQKIANASNEVSKYGISNICLEKTSGAKTKKFFIHCFGLDNFTRLTINFNNLS